MPAEGQKRTQSISKGIEKFMESCLENFPDWAAKIMDSQLLWFSLDLDGNFSVNIDNSVSPSIRKKLLVLLQDEVERGGHEVFEKSVVH